MTHGDLTYVVRGVLFDVHNELGPNLPESFCQKAVVIGLEEKGVQVETEKEFLVFYRGVQVGSYYVDIWVEGGKVLLELKVVFEIEPIHQAQTISYLKVTDADLALIVNFGRGLLQVERLPNYVREKSSSFNWVTKPMAANYLNPRIDG